jgi:hypothetical protein
MAFHPMVRRVISMHRDKKFLPAQRARTKAYHAPKCIDM